MQPRGLAGAIGRPWGARGSSRDTARAAQLIGRLRESRENNCQEAARARGWIVWPQGLAGLSGRPWEQLGIRGSERE